MIEPDGSVRPTVRNVNMTRDEREAVARHIVSVVGPAALKSKKAKADTLSSDPEVGGAEYRRKVVFPHVGISHANTFATRFNAFAKTLPPEDRRRLRLITLRLGPKPEPGMLITAMRALSKAIDASFDHLKGLNKAHPLLSAVHIRFDPVSGLADPHYQGIVDIPDRFVQPVAKYLKKRFEGVWMDEEPVQEPKKAAFYLGAGIFDYSAMEEWPDDLVLEAFNLPRYRFVRPAGDFAAGPVIEGTAKRKESTPPPSPLADAPERPNSARSGLIPLSGVKDRASAERAASDQISRLLAVIDRTGPGPIDSFYTVRPIPPESAARQLRDSASMEEIEFALEILGARLGVRFEPGHGFRNRARATFEDICRQRDVTFAAGLVAIALTETTLGYELFHREPGWKPHPCQQTLSDIGPVVAGILRSSRLLR